MGRVRLRTSLILSLQNIIARNLSIRISANDIKSLKKNAVVPLLETNDDLAIAGKISKETIDFLTGKIRAVESVVEQKARLKDQYRHLLTIPGIGKIPALTVMLETGPVKPLPKSGRLRILLPQSKYEVDEQR